VSTSAALGGSRGAREPVWARVGYALGPVAAFVVTAAVVAVVLAFLLLPIVALVVYQPVGVLLHDFNSQVSTDAIGVSLKTNLIAMGFTLLLGTPFAYALGRHRFPGRSVVITLVELPLVMPPAVAGIGLLVAYGRLGLLGHQLSALGIDLGLTQAAVVMAIILVASPFYLRGAIGAFEAIDPTLLDVAGTLGAGPLRRMLRVALPLAKAGLGASAALCFARGIGEFGATILFAGSFQGTTQTLPLAVYSLFDANLGQAIAVGVLLLIVSAAILLTAKLLGSWTSSISTSRFRGGRSTSAQHSA
jgi:molybdate transport system permease protein